MMAALSPTHSLTLTYPQVREATLGRPGWVHMGTDICYYRNSYQRPDSRRGRYYHTTTFTIKFPHSWDVCYMAYHYPYTYTQLLVSASASSAQLRSSACR